MICDRLLLVSCALILGCCTKEPPAVVPEVPVDLTSLEPYLLEVFIVPQSEDEVAIGSPKVNDTDEWRKRIEEKLQRAYIKGMMEKNDPAKPVEPVVTPVVKIVEVNLDKSLHGSTTVGIKFYVEDPVTGRIRGTVAQTVFKKLGEDRLWQEMGDDGEDNRAVLTFPTALAGKAEDDAAGSSRTFSIIAFVMGWVCLAALVVILAYLGIKYRDGIKSLARRIEQWSNPNRNGYSNLGGEVHSATDWRTDTEAAGEDAEDTKPKKKLRAPGGLLTDVEEVDHVNPPRPTQQQSYGTYTTPAPLDVAKDSSQVRLSDLATKEGTITPPMTPTSMQKHLIKKYQEKQVEEQTRADDPLTATSSEVFPDDFADCVEEEEIFQLKP